MRKWYQKGKRTYVVDTDQVVRKTFHNLVRLTGLHGGFVHANDDSLLRLGDADAVLSLWAGNSRNNEGGKGVRKRVSNRWLGHRRLFGWQRLRVESGSDGACPFSLLRNPSTLRNPSATQQPHLRIIPEDELSLGSPDLTA